MPQLNRRKFLSTLAAGAGGVAASSMLGMPAFAQDARIRHFWWGNPSRDERTFKVIDLFKENNAGSDVVGETIGWSDYWTKMATQTAGKNMADLVQMDYRYLFEYVRRGALLPLDDYFGKTLHLDGFDASALAGGMVDGKLYALNIGSNSQVCIFNTRMVQEAGSAAEFDPIAWTHDDLMRVGKAISENTPDGVYGTDDISLQAVSWELWSRQNGRNFYDGDKVNAKVEDLVSFWKFWKEMRDAGACSPADITVGLLGSSMADAGLVTQQTAMSYMWSNQIVGVQSLLQDTVGAAMHAHKVGGEPGQFIKPSMFMALTRDTSNPEVATAYMNAWVNDPAATAILGLERGIPASPTVRAALAPNFSPAEKVSVDYFTAIQDHVGTLPAPPPKGAGEVQDAYERIATTVVLGSTSIEDGAKAYFDEAESILFRAS